MQARESTMPTQRRAPNRAVRIGVHTPLMSSPGSFTWDELLKAPDTNPVTPCQTNGNQLPMSWCGRLRRPIGIRPQLGRALREDEETEVHRRDDSRSDCAQRVCIDIPSSSGPEDIEKEDGAATNTAGVLNTHADRDPAVTEIRAGRPQRGGIDVPSDLVEQNNRDDGGGVNLISDSWTAKLTRVPVKLPTTATIVAAGVEIHRRASSISKRQLIGRKKRRAAAGRAPCSRRSRPRIVLGNTSPQRRAPHRS